MAMSVLLAVGAVLVGPMATEAWAQETQQDDPPETQGVAICGEAMPDGSGEIARASFTLTNGTDTDVAFGTQRDPRRLRLDFDVRGCQFRRNQVGTEIHVRDPLLLDADGHSFEGDVTATGRIRSPTKVRVVIDIDPDNEADAGTFDDAVEILSGLGEPTVDPFTVTMQYANPVLAFATVFLPVLLLGSLAVWAKSYLALSPDERGRTPWLDSYREWWTQLGNLVAVAAGLVAARLAFGESFLGDPDWGAQSHGLPWLWPITSNEWWTLATVVLTAFTGAALAATLPADVVRERKKQDAAKAAS